VNKKGVKLNRTFQRYRQTPKFHTEQSRPIGRNDISVFFRLFFEIGDFLKREYDYAT